MPRRRRAARAWPANIGWATWHTALGTGFDAVLLLSGELNTFAPRVARLLLGAAHRALVSRGALVLEVHPEAFVQARGERSPHWFTAEQSVFCDGPHLCLRQSVWDPGARTSLERFFVLPGGGDEIQRYASLTHAYSDGEFSDLLAAAGFKGVDRHASLAGPQASPSDDLVVLIGRKG
jgi:hypothetical protein